MIPRTKLTTAALSRTLALAIGASALAQPPCAPDWVETFSGATAK